jgi:hypothetical protein
MLQQIASIDFSDNTEENFRFSDSKNIHHTAGVTVDSIES